MINWDDHQGLFFDIGILEWFNKVFRCIFKSKQPSHFVTSDNQCPLQSTISVNFLRFPTIHSPKFTVLVQLCLVLFPYLYTYAALQKYSFHSEQILKCQTSKLTTWLIFVHCVNPTTWQPDFEQQFSHLVAC